MHQTRYIVAALFIAGGANAQDTVHVRAGAPAWGTTVSLTPLYVIGGPPDYDLGALYATTVDRFNRFYAVDAKTKALHAFDANGKLLRTIGRFGSGPGEYRQILGLTMIQDSLLAAWDIANSRINVYKPDGTLDHTITMTRALTGLSGLLVSDTEDRFYMKSHFFVGSDGKSQTLPAAQIQWILMRPDGQFVDSIHEPQLAESKEPVMRTTAGPNFIPEGTVRPSPAGGIVYGLGDVYRFTIQPTSSFVVSDSRRQALTPQRAAASGGKLNPIRVVEVDWEPVPLTSEERASWEAFGDALSRADSAHPSYKVPKVKPAYRGFGIDHDGRIWISVYAKAEKRDLPPRAVPSPFPRLYWQQAPVYDVFDPTGRYLGRITLPFGHSFVAAHADRVWIKSIGDDGEDLVTVYKLTGLKGR